MVDASCSRKATMAMALFLAGALIGEALPAHAQGFSARAVVETALTDAGRAYILGLGQGLQVSNAYALRLGRAPLLCVPDGVSLGATDYVDVVREFLRQTDGNEDQPFDVVMVVALARKFPCSK